MNERGFEWIKQYKRERGARRIQDVLALSPDHDPFNIGSPAHRERAEWFVKLWAKHYQGQTGIHLRRIHYYLVSIQAQKPHYMPYENTKRDWCYLELAAMYARILHPDLVPPDAFEDRRNGQPYDLSWKGDRAWPPSPELDTSVPHDFWDLPSLHVNFASSDWRLGTPRVFGYAPDDYADRVFYLELWIEKSTMDDILIPLTEELGVRLVTSVGFQSITNAVHLLQRVREINKPTRVFYISDYDKSGRHMPVSAARHIEFWRKEYAPDSDVKLLVLALTKAQIGHYDLPTSMDSKGSVELDALEALRPGELARIVRKVIEPYLDETIGSQLAAAKAEAQEIVEDEWHQIMAPYERSLAALQKRVKRVANNYRKEVDRLNKGLSHDLAPLKKPLAALERNVSMAANGFNPDLPERPKAIAPADREETEVLFDSSRSYDEQLRFYKAQRGRD